MRRAVSLFGLFLNWPWNPSKSTRIGICVPQSSVVTIYGTNKITSIHRSGKFRVLWVNPQGKCIKKAWKTVQMVPNAPFSPVWVMLPKNCNSHENLNINYMFRNLHVPHMFWSPGVSHTGQESNERLILTLLVKLDSRKLKWRQWEKYRTISPLWWSCVSFYIKSQGSSSDQFSKQAPVVLLGWCIYRQ